MFKRSRSKEHTGNHIVIVFLSKETVKAEVVQLHLKIQIDIFKDIILCHWKMFRVRNTSINNNHFISNRIIKIQNRSFFYDKKYSLVIVDDDLIVTFSPQVLNIKNFELTLELKELSTKKTFRQLFDKAQELMDENERLNNIISNNVLLISTQAVPLLTNLLHLNPIITHFSVLKPDFILPKLNKEYLKKFKTIIFDLQDGGYTITTQKEAIKEYLMNGGNVIVTHDHWTFIPTSINGLEELLGATLIYQPNIFTTEATVTKDSHPIFNSYYNLNFRKGTPLTIALTHHTDAVYSNLDEYARDLLIELNDNIHGEYLMIKEYGKGKIVFWNAGSTYDLTDIEQKLFYNILAYLSDI